MFSVCVCVCVCLAWVWNATRALGIYSPVLLCSSGRSRPSGPAPRAGTARGSETEGLPARSCRHMSGEALEEPLWSNGWLVCNTD